MLRKGCFLFIAIILFSLKSTADKKTKLEIAFCLDLSGSTNGLIDNLRDNLWRFINNACYAKNTTDLRIGIVGYARPSFGASSAFIKVINDLTDDYDALSHELYKLKSDVEKGDQVVGSAMYVSISGLHWSKGADATKIIYLVGNGRVDLGKFDYRKACEIANSEHIIINSVYCLEQHASQKEMPQWLDIAQLTGGELYTMQISHVSSLYAHSPEEKWLADMNSQVTGTYIYYGPEGKEHYKTMLEADQMSYKVNPKAFYARCKYKYGSQYPIKSSSWDLVSLIKLNPPDFNSIDRKYLPDVLQKLDAQLIKKIVMDKKDEREAIMVQIRNKFNIHERDTSFTCQSDSIFCAGLKKMN